jgi:hypothetical protein
MPRRRGGRAGRRARDSRWTLDSGGVFGEGIDGISVIVKTVLLHCCSASTLPASVSVSVSVSESECRLEMEEGRPVGRKKQTDSSSPSSSLKWTHLGLGRGEWLGECVSGVFGLEMEPRP